jgi:uncharacterized spore protein YtfJ
MNQGQHPKNVARKGDETTMSTTVNDNETLQVIRDAVDSATVGSVFGAPIVQDGLTVVPVAKIGGGGGGGGGTGPEQTGSGSGAGFGLTAKPVGVFALKEGRLSWRPALDVNKVILGGQVVAVTALIVAGTIVRAVFRLRAARVEAGTDRPA